MNTRLLATLALALCFLAACASGPAPTSDNAAKPLSPPQPGEEFYEFATPGEAVPVLEGAEGGLLQEEGSAPGIGDTVVDLSKVIQRKDLESFLSHGPRHALRMVMVQPAFQSSRFQGFEIVGFSPASPTGIRQAFQKGDVVVAINKQSIARPEDYMSAWNGIKSQNQLTVTLMRGGETMDLIWSILD